MKLLLAYDDSDCANATVDDLARAGLPRDVHVMVLSVAEVWPNLPDSCFEPLSREALADMAPAVRKAHELAADALADAREHVQRGAQRITQVLPDAKVKSCCVGGTPAGRIVQTADEWKADLIAIGSHGRGAIARFALGSVSMAVLQHANCSVRIARSHKRAGPVRLIVGIDGSPGSAAAVSALTARPWPSGAEARVILALDNPLLTLPAAPEEFLTPLQPWVLQGNQYGEDWAQRTAEAIRADLQRAGLAASLVVEPGNPKDLLLQHARLWEADCIFVGARGLSQMERLLLGSVSSAVASRAPCSVEVVRSPA